MKTLVIALLVSLVAVVNCQLSPADQDCIMNFVSNNLNVATTIVADCGDLVRKLIMNVLTMC